MNCKMMGYRLLIVLLSLGLTVSLTRAGQYNRLTSDVTATLEGIKVIHVRVSPIDPDLEKGGISQAKILKNAKQQLQRAGIELLSEKDYDRLRAVRNYPLGQLEVAVASKNMGDVDGMIYSVNVRVRQAVFLSRKPIIKVFAPTWEESTIGCTRDLGVVQASVEDAVGKFIEAYLSVNP
jgi:hypothetical protein